MCGPPLDFTHLPSVPPGTAAQTGLVSGFLPAHIANMFAFHAMDNSTDLCALDPDDEPFDPYQSTAEPKASHDHQHPTPNHSTPVPQYGTSASPPPMGLIRGRQSEADAIVAALGSPSIVAAVLARSGATTRAALLAALREEKRHTKWRLGVCKKPWEKRPAAPGGGTAPGAAAPPPPPPTHRALRPGAAVPLPPLPPLPDSPPLPASRPDPRPAELAAQRPLPAPPPKSPHRRGWSLDSAPADLDPACAASAEEGGAPVDGAASLRQRFLSDADRSLPAAKPGGDTAKIAVMEQAAAAASGDGGAVRRDGKTLPRPLLIRSASAA